MKILKYLLALSLMVLWHCQACACDRNLTGMWKSDKGLSIAFNTANVKLQAKTERFLEAILGQMTLTFDGNELRVAMPDVTISTADGSRPLAGFQERKPYRVLFCSTAMIVWSARRPFGNEDEATIFNFEGPDTIWLYTGTSISGVPGLHTREYFQRVR